jgi:hypothetical protein
MMLVYMNLQSGPTPRGRVDSAARIEVDKVPRSTSASILFMIAIVEKTDGELDFHKLLCWTSSFGGRCH